MTPEQKLQAAREYERNHLEEMAELAMRGDELLRELARVKEERVKKYEDSLAERIKLQDPMLDITDEKHISSYMKRKYREHGIQGSLLAYFDGWIPAEHKTEEEKQIEVAITADGSSQSSMDEYRKPVSRLDSKEMVERDEYITEEKKKYAAAIKRLNDEQELLYDHAAETNLTLPSMKNTTISTPKPEPQDTEFSDALIEIANLFTDIARKVIEFPPSPEDARRFAEAAQTYVQILQPLTDLKNTKDHKGWLETIKTFEEYGKHAAAVKNAIQTPSGVNRPLTREQVGDKALEVIEGAIAMYNTDPLLVALAEHHRKYKEPRIAERKVNLHDTLSEKA